MTDQKAFDILAKGTTTNGDEYFKALTHAINRFIECRWYDYVEDDPLLYNNMMDLLLDIEYEDGSRGTVEGYVGFDSNRNVMCLKPVRKSHFTERATIKRWMKFPRYHKEDEVR